MRYADALTYTKVNKSDLVLVLTDEQFLQVGGDGISSGKGPKASTGERYAFTIAGLPAYTIEGVVGPLVVKRSHLPFLMEKADKLVLRER
jgi:hypothetical protein